MPTIVPSVDPTLPAPIPVLYGAEPSTAPLPIDPEPTPGGWVQPIYTEGLRLQVLLTDAVTHEVVDEITTAVVDDFDEDVELLVPGSASISASAFDPIWDAVDTRTTTGPDGTPVYGWTPKLYGVSIGVNGKARWPGLFRQPLDHGPDQQLLPARSPSVLFFEDTLGRVEQLDLYNGWGDFENFPIGSTPPGMHIPAGTTAVVVNDAVRGTRCLEVTGPGWVQCPRVPIPGQLGTGTSVEGSAFGKWPVEVEAGEPTIYTFTQRSDSLVKTNEKASRAKRGVRPDSETGWSEDPVTSGTTLSRSTLSHYTWVELRGHPDGIRYDLVRLAQGILTGFLVPTDGARYLEKILRDAKSVNLGGFPYGINSTVRSLVGHDEFAQTWNHNGMHLVSDVLSAAMDRDGGAEAYIDADNRLVIAGKLGQVRDDIVLSNDNTLEATWAIDPGAQADEYVGLTGRGSGTSLLASTVSQPRFANRHRITKIARIPNGMSLNNADAWVARHARVAARQQATGNCFVDWYLAEEIAKGDIVQTAFRAGVHGWWWPVRILNKRWIPAEHGCLLTWGATDDA